MEPTERVASKRDKVEEGFIEALGNLDAGGRARLKRNAGNGLADARNVYDVFYSIVPATVPNNQHERYFLVATLYAFGTRRSDPLDNPHRNFGASLRLVRDSDKAGSLDRRFNALLDADLTQLPFRLRQLVSLLSARRVAVDWAQLLTDLRGWTYVGRPIQRAWAQAYYQQATTSDKRDSSSTDKE